MVLDLFPWVLQTPLHLLHPLTLPGVGARHAEHAGMQDLLSRTILPWAFLNFTCS